MLLNLHKKTWMEGLNLKDYHDHCQGNEETVKTMLDLVKNYHKVCPRNVYLKGIKFRIIL